MDQVLKYLNFDLPNASKDAVQQKRSKNRNVVYCLTKILILDSFRTEAPLIFQPIVITVSCILIAASIKGYKIQQNL